MTIVLCDFVFMILLNFKTLCNKSDVFCVWSYICKFNNSEHDKILQAMMENSGLEETSDVYQGL
jgi:hypothetical protein